MTKRGAIKIILEQAELLPGDSTAVRVLVNLDEPLNVRGIVAEFEGFERTSAKYVTEVNGKRRTKTAKEINMLCQEAFVLHGEQKGTVSRLFDSTAAWFGGGSSNEMPAGEHEFSFEVSIPSEAPASFAGVKCDVIYWINVWIDVPIRTDVKRKEWLRVLSNEPTVEAKPVHVIYPDDTGKSLLDRAFGKKVKLNVALDRDQVTPGEQVLAMLVVESDDPLEVKEIKATLCGRESSKAKGHRDGHSHRHELAQIPSPKVISKESVFEFALDIPPSVDPPSGAGKRFDVKWWIEVRLDVPWAKDPKIKIPIELLNKRRLIDDALRPS